MVTCESIGFQGYCGAGEKEKRIEQVKIITKLTVLAESYLFFLHKCSLDCCKTLVHFQHSGKKKLILSVFASALVFLWRSGFRDLSAILGVTEL